jgi:retinol-binding protein 3
MKHIGLSFLTFIFCLALNPLFSQGQDPGKKLTRTEMKTLVDSIASILNRQYVFPDKGVVISGAIKEKFMAGSYDSFGNRLELSRQIRKDIQAAHRDPHLRFGYDPMLAAQLESKPAPEEVEKRREMDLAASRDGNFSFVRVEILPCDIGYIRWDAFSPYVDEAKPVLDAAFRFVSNCDALIIDMRYNGGGSPDMVLQTQNYFFDRKVPMCHIIEGKDTTMRYTDPSKTNFKLSMPVYILTSKSSFSGAEDFAYGMKYSGRALIVGDTTKGGAHPTRMFSFGQGFVGAVPFARSYHEVTKTDWEGTGVYPDVYIRSNDAMKKAQSLIIESAVSKTRDEREKNIYRWYLNELRAQAKLPPPEVLNAYTGTYEGGLDFYVSEGHLFCRNAERGNDIFELKHIESNLFLLDENVEVEFVRDEAGKCSKFRMLWKDGMVTERRRI